MAAFANRLARYAKAFRRSPRSKYVDDHNELLFRWEEHQMNIASVLTASAERNPRRAAIVLKNESISYGELDRSTTSLARWLLRQGFKRGSRIAILLAELDRNGEAFLCLLQSRNDRRADKRAHEDA